jgi:hypothetical protein
VALHIHELEDVRKDVRGGIPGHGLDDRCGSGWDARRGNVLGSRFDGRNCGVDDEQYRASVDDALMVTSLGQCHF